MDAWAAERRMKFSPNKKANVTFKKRNEELRKIMLKNKFIPCKKLYTAIYRTRMDYGC